MNQKITAINIADALATQLTFPKKVTDLFMHAFTDTILEGLDTDGIVKVKGLGTFRIVNVESRESVSVSTGERIVIPSFRKLTFTPEDSITDRMSGTTPEPVEQEEAPAEVPPVEEFFAAIKASEKPETTDAEPENAAEENPSEPSETMEPTGPVEESPNDEFSGIDVLIATPESLEELHDRLAEARQQQTEADIAVAEAQQRLDEAKAQALMAEQSVADAQQKAADQQAEVERIQKLIENVETNRLTQLAAVETPEAPDTPDVPEPPETPIITEIPENTETAETNETPAPVFTEPTSQPTHSHRRDEEKSPWWRIPLIILLLMLVGAICYFVAFNPRLPLQWLNLDKQEVPVQPKPEKPAEPKPTAKPEPKDSVKAEPATTPAEKPTEAKPTKTETPAKPQPTAEPKQEKPAEQPRPKTHKIRRGDTLTKISMQYYGTKDSVRAIIRANNFRDPNNINEGAVVKLP